MERQGTEHQVRQWTGLAGRQVQIRRGSRVVRTGRVEAMTPAGDVPWLENRDADPRILFAKAEGYAVREIHG
ncbi:hypothetical protein ACFQ36_19025 [Arthrobacter sp. GCM10027362]|uniref:hypothetical protein n=1 Tax=Arthrobacter sp. GCM10027362 TaxID=3273379 RepID=UPI00363D7805